MPATELGVVGVLGGMGPLATIDFMRKMLQATPAAIDQEHVPVVVSSIPQVPDRTEAFRGEGVSPLLAQVRLPNDWRVAVFVPPGPVAWHGDRERQAIARAGAASLPPGHTEALCRIALLDILPAAAAGDLAAFGDAVHEYNRRAGAPFAAVQGGAYAGPEVAELIERVRQLGVPGAGQSSWGPAVFAVVESNDKAAWLVQQLTGMARGWIAQQSEGHRVERE